MSPVSKPGAVKSAVNCAEPSVFGLLSTRGTRLPTSLKSFGSAPVNALRPPAQYATGQ